MKKILFSFLIFLLTYAPNTSLAFNTITDAYNLISNYIPSGSNVYRTTVIRSSIAFHLFYVDEEPTKGWEHNCSYFFVPQSGNLTFSKESYKFPHYPYTFTPYVINVACDTCIVDVKKTRLTEERLNDASKTYAVILSGGGNKNSNYCRYWNDCSFIYKTLRNRFHIDKSHITLLMSDGNNSAKDMVSIGGTLVSSPLDLDGDGIDDLQHAATKSNLQNVLTNLAHTMGADDRLFFFVIDHGGTLDYVSESYIKLWNEEKMYDHELADLLDLFNISSMNIVMGQCFSGGFIDDLSAPGRTITTACSGSQFSYSCSDYMHDEFVYHWTTAVNEHDENGEQVTSDSDKNGWVTMREAFMYANSNDVEPETPQFESNTIGESWAFNQSPFTYALMIRDNDEDIGEEPNTSTDIRWASPDVWLRNQNDGLVNTENQRIIVTGDEEQRFHVYYRITNIGEKDYPGKGMFIHSYWADATIGLGRTVWIGEDTNGTNINGGRLLPVCKISSVIHPGETIIIHKSFVVPNAILDRLEEDSTNSYHICFLTYLSNSQAESINPPLCPGTANVVDVLGKRTVSQINAYFMESPAQARFDFPLYINNPEADNREYCIEVLPVDEYPTDASKMEISLKMPVSSCETWGEHEGFTNGKRIYSSSSGTITLHGLHGKVSDIILTKGQHEKILCSCKIIANEDVAEAKSYAYDIALRDKKSGEYIDGERFVIRQQPRKAICPKIVTTPIEKGYLLEATNVDEEATFTWYDETGKTVGKGQKVEIIPSANNCSYKLMVDAKNDRCVNYAEVNLKSHFSIKDISPNPFHNQLKVVLNTPAEEGTIVRITPLSGIGKTEEFQFNENETELTITMPDYSRNIYVVSLLQNNNIVDSRQVKRE